jgi:hypothetical protein
MTSDTHAQLFAEAMRLARDQRATPAEQLAALFLARDIADDERTQTPQDTHTTQDLAFVPELADMWHLRFQDHEEDDDAPGR